MSGGGRGWTGFLLYSTWARCQSDCRRAHTSCYRRARITRRCIPSLLSRGRAKVRARRTRPQGQRPAGGRASMGHDPPREQLRGGDRRRHSDVGQDAGRGRGWEGGECSDRARGRGSGSDGAAAGVEAGVTRDRGERQRRRGAVLRTRDDCKPAEAASERSRSEGARLREGVGCKRGSRARRRRKQVGSSLGSRVHSFLRRSGGAECWAFDGLVPVQATCGGLGRSVLPLTFQPGHLHSTPDAPTTRTANETAALSSVPQRPLLLARRGCARRCAAPLPRRPAMLVYIARPHCSDSPL